MYLFMGLIILLFVILYGACVAAKRSDKKIEELLHEKNRENRE